MTDQRTRPVSLYVLMAALLFQGMSGVVGGLGLVTDPTGRAVGLPISWLQGSPFNDYLVPGLILLLGLGVFPLFVLYGLWARYAWAWIAALVVGLALIVWIGAEILIIGYYAQPPLQLIYGVLGFAIVALSVFPSVRAYYAEP